MLQRFLILFLFLVIINVWNTTDFVYFYMQESIL